MRTCSLLIASPSASFLPRIAQRIKLPTNSRSLSRFFGVRSTPHIVRFELVQRVQPTSRRSRGSLLLRPRVARVDRLQSGSGTASGMRRPGLPVIGLLRRWPRPRTTLRTAAPPPPAKWAGIPFRGAPPTAEPMVCRLTAGGNRIRTPVPLARVRYEAQE
jgi:hypothetical protein